MLIISDVIKHVIINIFCINALMHYLLTTTKYEQIFESVSEFYIYHLRKYMINFRFTFYESLQAQC
jgi:hypothetical protein